jgi:hypothetical protein
MSALGAKKPRDLATWRHISARAQSPLDAVLKIQVAVEGWGGEGSVSSVPARLPRDSQIEDAVESKNAKHLEWRGRLVSSRNELRRATRKTTDAGAMEEMRIGFRILQNVSNARVLAGWNAMVD